MCLLYCLCFLKAEQAKEVKRLVLIFFSFSFYHFCFSNVISHVGQYLVCDGNFFFCLHFHFVFVALLILNFMKKSGNFYLYFVVLLPVLYSKWISQLLQRAAKFYLDVQQSIKWIYHTSLSIVVEFKQHYCLGKLFAKGTTQVDVFCWN